MDIRAQFYEAALARAPKRVDAKAELYASVKALVDKDKLKNPESAVLTEKPQGPDARAELLTSVKAVLGLKRVAAGPPQEALAKEKVFSQIHVGNECHPGRGSPDMFEANGAGIVSKVVSEPLDMVPKPQSGSRRQSLRASSGELEHPDKENVRRDPNIIRDQGGKQEPSQCAATKAKQVVQFKEQVDIYNYLTLGVRTAPLKKAKQTYPLAELYLLNPARKSAIIPAHPSESKSGDAVEETTMPDQEKRKDTDGRWYTKAEFVQCYGGTAEWDRATKKPQPPPKPREPERRVSEEDGVSYTKQEFIDYFGGTAEWDRAKPEKKNKDFVKDLSLLERRLAPDGRTYTKKQFIEYYGDLVEWDKAGEKLGLNKPTTAAAPPKQEAAAGQKKNSPKHAMSFSQATRGGQQTAGDVARRAPARPPVKPNKNLERRRAPDGQWLDKEEFVDCYSLEEWYNAEEEKKPQSQSTQGDIPEKLNDIALQRLVAEVNRLDESLHHEFRQVYGAVGMEPSSLSMDEVTLVEKQLKEVIMAEEKCLMVAKQYAAYLGQRSAEFFERKKLEGLEADYIRQYEYQLKAARAEFGDIQTERLEGIKGKLKMLYKTKDSTWMKWRGRRKELEMQIKHHGADPRILRAGSQPSRRSQENGVAPQSGKPPAPARNEVKQLFVAALKHVINVKKTSMPFNASSIMLAMQDLSGKKFSMKDTPFSSLKGLVNEMVNEGHLKVAMMENTLVVTSTVHAA